MEYLFGIHSDLSVVRSPLNSLIVLVLGYKLNVFKVIMYTAFAFIHISLLLIINFLS